MARPRQYDSLAAKQAAYRARQEARCVVVDRVALAGLHERLDRLQGAIALAAKSGVPFASRCRAASIDSMLDKLVDAFLEESSSSAECADVKSQNGNLESRPDIATF